MTEVINIMSGLISILVIVFQMGFKLGERMAILNNKNNDK